MEITATSQPSNRWQSVAVSLTRCGGLLRFIGLFMPPSGWVVQSSFHSGRTVFFSPEVMRFTPPPYNGLVAQACSRFSCHYIWRRPSCTYLPIGETRHLPQNQSSMSSSCWPRAARRKWISPKLTIWHQQRISGQERRSTAHDRTQRLLERRARRQTQVHIWHGVSQTVNLIMLMMLVWRFWRLSHPITGQPQTYVETKRNSSRPKVASAKP